MLYQKAHAYNAQMVQLHAQRRPALVGCALYRRALAQTQVINAQQIQIVYKSKPPAHHAQTAVIHAQWCHAKMDNVLGRSQVAKGLLTAAVLADKPAPTEWSALISPMIATQPWAPIVQEFALQVVHKTPIVQPPLAHAQCVQVMTRTHAQQPLVLLDSAQ